MASNLGALSQAAEQKVRVRSLRSMIWRQYRRHIPAMVSTVVLAIMVAAVYLAPLIAPYEFDAINLKYIKQPPSAAHLMGTDDLGRDLFTRVLYGGRISMSIGLFAALMSSAIGALVGAVAGFYGGRLDNVLMRLTDVAYSIPSLPLLIVLSSFTDAAVPAMVLIIGLLSWMGTARVVRSSVLSIREQEYITAARMIGARNWKIIMRHILPNAFGPIIVGATLGVGSAIIVESSLSFLGLGISPPTPTWGNMLQDSQATMASKPWLTIFPGLSILVTVLCINFIGEGLHDSLDPTLRKS